MTNTAILKKLYVMFSCGGSTTFNEGAIVRPFVCLAMALSDDLVYTILPHMVYAAPYEGGIVHLEHTLRKGSRTDLSQQIPEGALVAIVVGIMGSNTTEAQSGMFMASGGIYLE